MTKIVYKLCFSDTNSLCRIIGNYFSRDYITITKEVYDMLQHVVTERVNCFLQNDSSHFRGLPITQLLALTVYHTRDSTICYAPLSRHPFEEIKIYAFRIERNIWY